MPMWPSMRASRSRASARLPLTSAKFFSVNAAVLHKFLEQVLVTGLEDRGPGGEVTQSLVRLVQLVSVLVQLVAGLGALPALLVDAPEHGGERCGDHREECSAHGDECGLHAGNTTGRPGSLQL